MAKYAAFLRAINVGNRKATGEQLRSAAQRAGFAEAASFRNSGNLVLSAARLQIGTLAKRLERGLRDELGFEVPVFVRSARQLKVIAAHEPFPPRLIAASKGKLQVVLLGRRPAAAAGRKALALAGEDDRLALRGSELYWLPTAGTPGLRSRPGGAWTDPRESTMRTKGTIEQIAAKHFAA